MGTRGFVTTARGEVINLDEMIARAQQPIAAEDHATRKRGSYTPEVSNNPRVRGFVPGRGDTDIMEPDDEDITTEAGSAEKTRDHRSLADMTSITVQKKGDTRKPSRPSQNSSPTEDADDDETLGSLMEQIDNKGTKGKKS